MKSHHYSRDKQFSSSKRAILGSAAGEKSSEKKSPSSSIETTKTMRFWIGTYVQGVDSASSSDARRSSFEPRFVWNYSFFTLKPSGSGELGAAAPPT